jgi:hypothetical protein
MQTFTKSPMLALNPRGKAAVELTEQLLTQLEDLVDRVALVENRLQYVERQGEILDRDLMSVELRR